MAAGCWYSGGCQVPKLRSEPPSQAITAGCKAGNAVSSTRLGRGTSIYCRSVVDSRRRPETAVEDRKPQRDSGRCPSPRGARERGLRVAATVSPASSAARQGKGAQAVPPRVRLSRLVGQGNGAWRFASLVPVARIGSSRREALHSATASARGAWRGTTSAAEAHARVCAGRSGRPRTTRSLSATRPGRPALRSLASSVRLVSPRGCPGGVSNRHGRPGVIAL